MPTPILLFLILALGGASAFYAFWHAKNRVGYKKRIQQSQTQKPQKGRATDAMKLSKQEQKILSKAKEMARSGNIRPAAHLLEQSGLQRQCIELLEVSGLIDDAANVLLKMQRPNRAGYVYARNGKWLQAADCFKNANLLGEAAKCYREAGRFDDAAELYKQSGNLEDTANCYIMNKKWQKAGQIFLKSQNFESATNAYEHLFKADSKYVFGTYDDIEIDFFRDSISKGQIKNEFIEILAQNGKISELIRTVLKGGSIAEAAKLYLKSGIDLGPLLMSEVNIQGTEGVALANMFMKISNFKYAGMVYEQIGDFRQAASAFEQAEDFERASYCYERSGDKSMARSLRGKTSQSSNSSVPTKKPEMISNSFSDDPSESTQAIRIDNFDMPARAFEIKAKPMVVPLKGSVGVFSLDPPSKTNQANLDPDKVLFHECRLFEELDYQQRSRIWELGKTTSFETGAIIVDWSQEPQGFHFVLEGELDCILNSESGEVPLETIAKGDTFGEIWLLAEKPASVRLVARTTSRLLIIEREKFLEMLDQDGTIARKVYKHFTHRLLAKLLNPSKPQDIRHAS